MRETSDEALLAACLRGDQLAWNELIDRYAALIYSIPLKYGLGEPDAADVFQSVCITLLEKLGSIRAPQGLAAWIITTTRRQCLAVARQKRREQLHSMPAGLAAEDIGPIDPDLLPDEEVLSLERQHLVRHAVERLPETCRRLLNALFTRIRASPIFDSRRPGLALAGVRSLGAIGGPWQLLYRGGDVEVDLLVRPNRDGHTLNVRGQALSLGGGSVGLGVVEALPADTPRRLQGRPAPTARSELQPSGEFALSHLERGRYDVLLRFGTREIELSGVEL